MTEIGFYHLQRSALEQVLPRLLGKALERGMRVVVLAGSDERVKALDGALWTFDQGSFLPHGTAAGDFAAEQPVYLTTDEENPNGATLLALTLRQAQGEACGLCLILSLSKDGAPPKQTK